MAIIAARHSSSRGTACRTRCGEFNKSFIGACFQLLELVPATPELPPHIAQTPYYFHVNGDASTTDSPASAQEE